MSGFVLETLDPCQKDDVELKKLYY